MSCKNKGFYDGFPEASVMVVFKTINILYSCGKVKAKPFIK